MKKNILIIIFFLITLNASIQAEEVNYYIPDDFYCYIKVDSLKSAYENIIDLKSLDLILTRKDFENLYLTLLNIRNSKFYKNKILTTLLDMKINIILDKNLSPLLICDLGIKSILFQGISFFLKHMNESDEFSYKEIKNEKNISIYELTLKKNNLKYYLNFKDNILLLSLSEQNIYNAYNTASLKKTYTNKTYIYSDKENEKKDKIKIYLNTENIIKPFASSIPLLTKMINKISFDSNTAVDLKVSNDNLSILSKSTISIKDIELKELVNNKGKQLEVQNYLPEETLLFSAFSIQSFEDFYKLILYMEKGSYKDTINTIENNTKAIFNMKLDEMFFSWIGDELGVFSLNNSNSFGVFLKIKNKEKYDKVMKKLSSSIILDAKNSIYYEDVKLNKLDVSDFFNYLLEYFIGKIETPYFMTLGDYVFFSMEPSVLYSIAKSYKENKTLIKDTVYNDIASNTMQKGNLFLYYNIKNEIPKFFNIDNVYYDILKLYKAGAIVLDYNDNQFIIDTNCKGFKDITVRNYYGYPKKTNEKITSDILCYNVTGNELMELVYSVKNKIVTADINNNIIDNMTLNIIGDKINFPILKQNNNFYFITDKGYIYKTDNFLNVQNNYPIKTSTKESNVFNIINDNYIVFDKNKNKFLLYEDKGIEKEIKFENKYPMLSNVSIFKDNILFYPKNFHGTIYNINFHGNIIDGWPKDAGSLGFGCPVIGNLGMDEKKCVIFITQAGLLNVWTLKGEQLIGFPLKLDGIYYKQPVIGNISDTDGNEIICIDNDGVIRIITVDNRKTISKKIENLKSKNTEIMLYDIDNDKKDEIFLYGSFNKIYILNQKLENIAGTPVKGNTRPFITDIDNDNVKEMATYSLDNYLCIYKLY